MSAPRLEMLSHAAQKESEFWCGIRIMLKAGLDFTILCPNYKRAKKILAEITSLVHELNSQSKFKTLIPRKTGCRPRATITDDIWSEKFWKWRK